MYFVLGLLAAGLVALALSPAVWRRAHRLAKARVESSLPMSMGEVQAEKDQLRASFAISARRLEMQVEDLRKTSTEQTLAAGRLKGEIAALNAELEDRKAAILGFESRLVEAGDALKAAEGRTSSARAEVAAREATLRERAGQIAALEARLAAAQQLTEEQRLEILARDTAIGNLQDQLTASRAGEALVAAARDEFAAALAAESAALAAEKSRGRGLEAQIVALGVERADRLAALDRRAGEIRALEAEIAALRAGAASPGLAAAANDAGDNMRKAIEAMEAEKSTLEARLAAIEADHATTLAENADLKRLAAQAGDAAAGDAALHARLAEIAENVVRLTRPAGEGEATPARRPEKTNGVHGGNGGVHRAPAVADGPAEPETEMASAEPPKPPAGRTLAERIRALQHTARH
jgi:chromosome segregation ATPase